MGDIIDRFCDLADALLTPDEGITERAYAELLRMADMLGVTIGNAIQANTNATDGRFYYREGFTLKGYRA